MAVHIQQEGLRHQVQVEVQEPQVSLLSAPDREVAVDRELSERTDQEM